MIRQSGCRVRGDFTDLASMSHASMKEIYRSTHCYITHVQLQTRVACYCVWTACAYARVSLDGMCCVYRTDGLRAVDGGSALMNVGSLDNGTMDTNREFFVQHGPPQGNTLEKKTIEQQ